FDIRYSTFDIGSRKCRISNVEYRMSNLESNSAQILRQNAVVLFNELFVFRRNRLVFIEQGILQNQILDLRLQGDNGAVDAVHIGDGGPVHAARGSAAGVPGG